MTTIENGLAFIFPGQGSQSVGMLAELAAEHPEVSETFRSASDVLGYDLWSLVCDGPVEALNQTERTQPAMLAAGVAAYRVWCKLTDVRPGTMAGHSLGEYTALVCADAIGFEDGIRLVAERGRLMQGAVAEGVGAMAAILGMDDPDVVAICKELSTDDDLVAPANFNAPGQIVIAGHASAVARAVDAAKAKGAKRAVVLPVSVPSHCLLMKTAADRFKDVLAQIDVRSPTTPVVHNVDVGVHPSPEMIRALLEQQLYCSVRWSDSITFMFQQGIHRFIECGPGKVLIGLNKRIAPESRAEALFSPDSLIKALELIN